MVRGEVATLRFTAPAGFLLTCLQYKDVTEGGKTASLLPADGLDGEVKAKFERVAWPFPVDVGRSKGLY